MGGVLAKIRKVKRDDLAAIASLILKWDSELPEWASQVKGNAQWAEWSATLIVQYPEKFIGRVLEVDGEVVGGFCINRAISIFSPEPYGQLLMWYVHPRYRGGKLYGLRLLQEAVKVAASEGLSRLEVYPWADDAGASAVLHRLGFVEAVHVWTKETGYVKGK